MKPHMYFKTLIFTGVVLITHGILAQNYNNAIGLRAGLTSGLTVKHFMGSNKAIEGIIGVWPYNTSLTGLYEIHQNLGSQGLNFYYGGGAHVSVYTGRIYYNAYYDRYYRTYADHALGLDLIAGLEYKIPQIPFAISLDVKPFMEIHRGGGIYTAWDPGLGLKIAF